MTEDFYGLPMSRTNQARISTARRWLRRTVLALLVLVSLLGGAGFYRTFISPPDLNIEAASQRISNQHDLLGGFAADFVEMWLTSTGAAMAGLAQFIDTKAAGPPPAREFPAATQAASRPAAILYRGSVGEVALYSVTVTVVQRQIPTAVPRRTFYRMPLILWNQQPRIIGWPMAVNGPGPGVQIKLDYPRTLKQSAPLYKTLADFTDAYLTRTTGMDRYALPGTVSPVGGYATGQLLSVQLSEEPPEKPPPGVRIHALLQVLAKTGDLIPVPMTLPITLESSNGAWMVGAIDLVPLVADAAPQPLAAGG